jgi:hypothetical protein
MYAKGIDFTSFYDFSVVFWNYFDSVGFFVKIYHTVRIVSIPNRKIDAKGKAHRQWQHSFLPGWVEE